MVCFHGNQLRRLEFGSLAFWAKMDCVVCVDLVVSMLFFLSWELAWLAYKL